jgi:hypothetical protein
MGCALYIRCALYIHKKEYRKSLGWALYIGARYLPENTVLRVIISHYVHAGDTRWCSAVQWLRHCATNRKVAGSIPEGVRIFH